MTQFSKQLDLLENNHVCGQGEERPFLIAFKHGLEEEKV